MMAPRKILFISFGDLSTTGCIRASQLAVHLGRLGWDAQVAIPDTPSNRAFEHSEESNRFFYDPTAKKILPSLGGILRKERPDFVHMLNPKEKALMLSSIHQRQKFVFDWEDWTTFVEQNPIRRWYKEMRDRWLIRRAATVITASSWLSSYILSRFSRDSLYLPYACLPKEFPNPGSGNIKSVAVGMGSLHPNWDHDLLVEAAGVLRGRGQEVPIRWIGKGAELERCHARVAELGLEKFEFPGYLDWEPMLRELREAHCLVFPIRRKELNLARCPFKCFQFAQAQRPVITSDVGEVRSILGDHAVYVEPTAEALADAIYETMLRARQPDVAYDLSKHTWEQRAVVLSEHLQAI